MDKDPALVPRSPMSLAFDSRPDKVRNLTGKKDKEDQKRKVHFFFLQTIF